MRRTLVLAALAAAGILLGLRAEVTLRGDVQPIWDRECTDCHGGKRAKAGLDLSAGKSLSALVGVPSKQVPSVMLVKAGDPEASYLWQKLTHTAKEGKGMPRGWFTAKKLPEKDLETIRAWILGGAKE